MIGRQRHDEFVELLTQHRSQLFGYIHSLVHNLQDTEDIFQSTCLILWEKYDEYRPGTKFVSWACETARLKTCNFLKRDQKRRFIFSEEVQLQLAAQQAKLEKDSPDHYQEALTGCVEKLSAPDRRLVNLCYGDTCNFKEIAEQLGRSPKSIYDALSRVRRALLSCVQHTLAQEGHS